MSSTELTPYNPPTAQVAVYVEVLGLKLAVEFRLACSGAKLMLSTDPKGRGPLEKLVGYERANAPADQEHRLEKAGAAGKALVDPAPCRFRLLHSRHCPHPADQRRDSAGHSEKQEAEPMTDDLSLLLTRLTEQRRDALILSVNAKDANTKAYTTLVDTLNLLASMNVQDAIKALPEPTAPPSEHQAEHRSGPQRKIETDTDLSVFTQTQIYRMIFVQIANKVTQHLSPERRVGKSAIWNWWKRNQK